MKKLEASHNKHLKRHGAWSFGMGNVQRVKLAEKEMNKKMLWR